MYDLIIVGAGPAGLTASIYASCYHLKHLVIGKLPGGQMLLAPDIINYPGFEDISGKELTGRMVEQAKKRGGEIEIDLVMRISSIPNFSDTQANGSIRDRGPINSALQDQSPTGRDRSSKLVSSDIPLLSSFEVETQVGKIYQTKTIILATGMERRKLNVPGETEYTGRGVHYCATCEKHDYAKKICAVVGGANSALQAAVKIAQAAAKVYIIYRGATLRGDPVWLAQVEKNSKIEVIYNTQVVEIVGDGMKVTGVRINPINAPQPFRMNLQGEPPLTVRGGEGALPLDKLFIEIGGVPGTALVVPLGVVMDKGGYINVNERLETNVAGIFAAGDLVNFGLAFEQISTSVGLGARAAASAFTFLKQEKTPSVWGEGQIRR